MPTMDFHEMPAWMRKYFTDLENKINNMIVIGNQWRIIEGPYPKDGSPNCIQIQFRKGTMWQTVLAYKPDGSAA